MTTLIHHGCLGLLPAGYIFGLSVIHLPATSLPYAAGRYKGQIEQSSNDALTVFSGPCLKHITLTRQPFLVGDE